MANESDTVPMRRLRSLLWRGDLAPCLHSLRREHEPRAVELGALFASCPREAGLDGGAAVAECSLAEEPLTVAHPREPRLANKLKRYFLVG